MSAPAPEGDGTPGEGPRRSAPVSVLTIPLLFLGLVLGFLAALALGPWGALVVLAVGVGCLSAVLTGRDRDAATGLVAGTAAGYVLMLLVIVFRGGL